MNQPDADKLVMAGGGTFPYHRILTVDVKLYPPGGMWSESPTRKPVTFEIILQRAGDNSCYKAEGVSCDWWPGDRKRKEGILKIGQRSRDYLGEVASLLSESIQQRHIPEYMRVEGLTIALVREAANEAISRNE
jgi:hypothetical protein